MDLKVYALLNEKIKAATGVDLSNYVTKNELNTVVAAKTEEAVESKLTNDSATTEEIDEIFNGGN